MQDSMLLVSILYIYVYLEFSLAFVRSIGFHMNTL